MKRPLAFALAGGTLLALAMPGMLPGALASIGPLLVLPGLMAFYALITASPRPLRHGYLFGCLFMAWFSWSVHHVLFAAYAAIVVTGGLYFLLAAAALRGLGRWRVVRFAAATAAIFWLRAGMPEIYYPHGQPTHALFEWPALLLGALVVGGEPLCNALLAALAAAVVEAWRGWRTAEPEFVGARRQLVVTGLAVVAVSLLGSLTRSAPAATAEVDVAAIEPGLHPMDPYLGLDAAAAHARYDELLEQRLLLPTRALAMAAAPPDVVLWPEASLPLTVLPIEDVLAGKLRSPLPGAWPADAPPVVIGAQLERDGREVPAAFLLDPRSGRVRGHNEKVRRVPGGEFIPVVGLLPEGLADSIRRAFEEALGTPPETAPGLPQPPLELAGGQRFGALICYDNAFPEPAGQLVSAGARFLVVVSNEAWYRGGAELPQLVAMSVCRALETGVPLIRCTTDGWSVAIDRDGRLIAALALQPAPTPAPRILRAKLRIGPPAETPMASLRPFTGPLMAAWLALSILHGALAWARLAVTRKAS